jgi:hypothetical protein
MRTTQQDESRFNISDFGSYPVQTSVGGRSSLRISWLATVPPDTWLATVPPDTGRDIIWY